MNVLSAEDISRLSIFQCKLCRNRLRRPIMHVAGIGNICGCCYKNTKTKKVVRNTELEEFLEKLHLPCSNAQKGCEVDGSFNDICNHETNLCFFHDRSCPLKWQDLYEEDFNSVDELIMHIKQEHPNNVLDLESGSTHSVENPNESKLDVFYLLVANAMDFVLNARFDVIGQQIMYEFYCVGYNKEITNVKVAIILQSGDSIFNLSNIRMKRLRRDEFPYVLDAANASKITLTILESFGCLENIIIGVDIEDNKVKDQLKTMDDAVWYECNKCSTLFKEISLCVNQCEPTPPVRNTNLDNMFCAMQENTYYNYMPLIPAYSSQYTMVLECATCLKASSSRNPNKYISPSNILVPKSAFPCKNPGCGKQIKASEYQLHKSLCRFRNYACDLTEAGDKCKWQGLAAVVADHLRRCHPNVLNVQKVKFAQQGSTVCYFFKENNVFRQEYSFNNPGIGVPPTVAVTASNLLELDTHHKYVWQFYFQDPITGSKMVISSKNTHDLLARNIDVRDYLVDDTVEFEVIFNVIV